MSDLVELKEFSDKLKAALSKKRVTLDNDYDSVAISDQYKIEFASRIPPGSGWADYYMLVPVGTSSFNPKPIAGWKTHSRGTGSYILPPKNIQQEVLSHLNKLSSDTLSFKELREKRQKDAAIARQAQDFSNALAGHLYALKFTFPEHSHDEESVLRLNEKYSIVADMSGGNNNCRLVLNAAVDKFGRRAARSAETEGWEYPKRGPGLPPQSVRDEVLKFLSDATPESAFLKEHAAKVQLSYERGFRVKELSDMIERQGSLKKTVEIDGEKYGFVKANRIIKTKEENRQGEVVSRGKWLDIYQVVPEELVKFGDLAVWNPSAKDFPSDWYVLSKGTGSFVLPPPEFIEKLRTALATNRPVGAAKPPAEPPAIAALSGAQNQGKLAGVSAGLQLGG